MAPPSHNTKMYEHLERMMKAQEATSAATGRLSNLKMPAAFSLEVADFTTSLDTTKLRNEFPFLENQFRRPAGQRCFQLVAQNQEGQSPHLCRVGDGASGVVYLAVHKQHGLVALKAFGFDEPPPDMEDIQHEIDMHRHVNAKAPSAAPILHGVCNNEPPILRESGPFLVMEFISCVGSDDRRNSEEKATHVHQRMSMSWRTQVAKLSQLARSVHALHEAGVLHCDLKNNNWGTLAKNKQAVVFDFGMAERLGDNNIAQVAFKPLKSRSDEAKLCFWHAPERLIAQTVKVEEAQRGDRVEVWGWPHPNRWNLGKLVTITGAPTSGVYVGQRDSKPSWHIRIDPVAPRRLGEFTIKMYDPAKMRKFQPEFAQRKVSLSPASDWFSYGITLVELLCGSKGVTKDPGRYSKYKHRVFNDAFDFRATDWYQTAHDVDPQLANEMSALVGGLLHSDPANRPLGREVVAKLDAIDKHCKKQHKENNKSLKRSRQGDETTDKGKVKALKHRKW